MRDSGKLEGQGQGLDKTLIVKDDMHKSTASERLEEESKQKITIPAYETYWRRIPRIPRKRQSMIEKHIQASQGGYNCPSQSYRVQVEHP